MNDEQKYKRAIEIAKECLQDGTITAIARACIWKIFPELKESEGEMIRKRLEELIEAMPDNSIEFKELKRIDVLHWLEKQGERKLVNFDEAEKEKSDFVGDGFIRCLANFLDFKKGETYWLEYIGDDNYNVRSDNLLGKTYHITPCQLYTVFKKITWLEKQGEVAYNPYKETVKSIANMCDKYATKMNNEEDANDFLQNVKVKCKDAIEFEKQGVKNNQETAEDIDGTKVKAIDWEQRRYETAREIYANLFIGNITAAKAIEKADELLELLKGGKQ